MAGVSSRIVAAALALGASTSVYDYVARASHSDAQEFSKNHRNSRSTRVPQEYINQMTRAANFSPGCAPQFDALNFVETIIIPAQMYRL